MMKRLAATLLLLMTGCFSDLLVTQEPDAFFRPRPLRAGQADVGLRVMHSTTEQTVYGVGAALGVGRDWEARVGWARAGTHWRESDSARLFLNALEFRGRRGILADGPFRLAAGGGCDVFFADPGEGGPLEYYGLRPTLQAAAGVYTDVGFGLFVPLAVSGTFLTPEQAVGWSITPGVGAALELEHFFIRVAANYPLGRFCRTDALPRFRMMAMSAGLELGGRLSLFGSARDRD